MLLITVKPTGDTSNKEQETLHSSAVKHNSLCNVVILAAQTAYTACQATSNDVLQDVCAFDVNTGITNLVQQRGKTLNNLHGMKHEEEVRAV